MRSACSLFLYHMPVMVMNAGLTAPSATPRKNRTARNAGYVFGAARHIQTAPHKTLVPEVRELMPDLGHVELTS